MANEAWIDFYAGIFTGLAAGRDEAFHARSRKLDAEYIKQTAKSNDIISSQYLDLVLSASVRKYFKTSIYCGYMGSYQEHPKVSTLCLD